MTLLPNRLANSFEILRVLKNTFKIQGLERLEASFFNEVYGEHAYVEFRRGLICKKEGEFPPGLLLLASLQMRL